MTGEHRRIAGMCSGVVIALTLIAGCGAEKPDNTVDPRVLNQLGSLLDDARTNEASEQTIAVLELAISEQRNVTFGEYREAHQAAIDCLEGLGLSVTNYSETERAGRTEISYFYGGLDQAKMDALDAPMMACVNENAMYIDLAYQINSPTVDVDALYEHFRPLMIECVNREGASLPPDATMNEAIDADSELTDANPLRELCGVTTGFTGAT